MNLAILVCNGLDKLEGSLTREVALRLVEKAGAEIICPVALNRTPARYKKVLAENRLIVVDGCATQCASRLAVGAKKKPARRLVLTELLKRSGRTLGRELRLDSEALALAGSIAADILEDERVESERAHTPQATAEASAETPAEVPAEAARAEERFASPSDYFIIVHEKYEFRVPRTGFFFNPNDVWAQVVGDRARVGLSDYMQQRLTDITFVELPELGASIEQFGEVGSVESTKASFEVVSPVGGTVVRVNEALLDMPEAINEDPYGSWIAELALVSWQEDRTLLLDGAAYAKEIARKAVEDQ